MTRPALLRVTEAGLYCEAGDFYIDPWRPVARAVTTHAHADHAVRGSGAYLVARQGLRVFERRLGPDAPLDAADYGERRRLGDATVSLHPAGHILGSAQVRVERDGEVWVVSGDYKVAADPTCAPFEPQRCHVFVSECTFGLPIYRWPRPEALAAEINQWWRDNAAAGRPSLLLAYALGKAQRALASLDPSIGPIYGHGAVEPLHAAYRDSGVELPATRSVGESDEPGAFRTALILAPPSALGTPWVRRFRDPSTAFASGWMLVRGARRRRSVDRGFALSDHADWEDLQAAIAATGAERVLLTHGSTAAVVRWLREQGHDADALTTRYGGEQDDDPTEAA
ncbi:MAG: ligase-associated DNA damage response exonuclease [Acidobacteria bacterium]|nr:ligase-associated DNA damage response exonuclease [Acidobacteriota bacterium]